MKDQISSDVIVKKRIEYIKNFCRNIIRNELEKVKTKDH